MCVVLIEADIFNKAVQGNIPKPLKNLYIKFDVNTLRHCGEMACVEEYLHTFGNSDITTIILYYAGPLSCILGCNYTVTNNNKLLPQPLAQARPTMPCIL